MFLDFREILEIREITRGDLPTMGDRPARGDKLCGEAQRRDLIVASEARGTTLQKLIASEVKSEVKK